MKRFLDILYPPIFDTQNCAYQKYLESCIFDLTPGAINKLPLVFSKWQKKQREKHNDNRKD